MKYRIVKRQSVSSLDGKIKDWYVPQKRFLWFWLNLDGLGVGHMNMKCAIQDIESHRIKLKPEKIVWTDEA